MDGAAQYIGSERSDIQNQKWILTSFDLQIKIYVNKDAHNFEMRQPKGSFDFTKNELTCKFCPFCFVIIRVKFVFPETFFSESHNLVQSCYISYIFSDIAGAVSF